MINFSLLNEVSDTVKSVGKASLAIAGGMELGSRYNKHKLNNMYKERMKHNVEDSMIKGKIGDLEIKTNAIDTERLNNLNSQTKKLFDTSTDEIEKYQPTAWIKKGFNAIVNKEN